MLHFTHLIHFQDAAGLAGLNDSQVWVAHLLELAAGPASPARDTEGRGCEAVQRLRQSQGQSPPAYTFRPGDQVSVVLRASSDLLA
jgi:hypothetical protein